MRSEFNMPPGVSTRDIPGNEPDFGRAAATNMAAPTEPAGETPSKLTDLERKFESARQFRLRTCDSPTDYQNLAISSEECATTAYAIRGFIRLLHENADLRRERGKLMDRLNPSIEYVEGTPVGYGEDEIDRLHRRAEEAESQLAEWKKVTARETPADCEKGIGQLYHRWKEAERQLKAEREQSAYYLANWKATEEGYNNAKARRVEAEHQLAAARAGERKVCMNPAEYWPALVEHMKKEPIMGWQQDKSGDPDPL